MNNTSCRYAFKDLAAYSCFNCAAHQAILDTYELDDSEEFVHLAGGIDDDVDAPAVSFEDANDTSLSVPASKLYVAVATLIAAGLQNLIKWWVF